MRQTGKQSAHCNYCPNHWPHLSLLMELCGPYSCSAEVKVYRNSFRNSCVWCFAQSSHYKMDAITICNQDREVGQEMLGNLDSAEAPTKGFYHEPWDLWHTFLSHTRSRIFNSRLPVQRNTLHWKLTSTWLCPKRGI